MKKDLHLSEAEVNSKVRDCHSYRLLEEAMTHVQLSLKTLPEPCRPYRGNALLNLALGFLIAQHGQVGAAQLLSRLQHSLAADCFPASGDEAMDPFRLDG